MTTRETTNTHRKTAIIVGALFLTAIVASIVGGLIIEAILTAPDYLNDISANETQVVLGVLLELINAIAVVGIAAMMFPLLKKQNEGLALGYVGLRFIEAVIAVGAVVTPLTLIALSQEYLTAGASDASYFQPLGTSLIEVRAQLVGQILAIFFGLSALLFYYLLYQLKLVPRFISVWGLIGAVLILTWNLLLIFGVSVSAGMILALPMILNEIFLGIWLIAKGFNPSAIASESA